MNKDTDTTNPGEDKPTPDIDRLLKILEIQSASHKERFRPSPLQSNSFRYGSLVVITIIAFGSLGILEWFLSQMPHGPHAAAPGNAPSPAKNASASPANFHN